MNPFSLAKRQLALDRKRMAHRPWLLAHKIERMAVSPFAFLRGAAPLFYALLKEDPSLARGATGNGWIAGDLHLENFGCYRPEPPEHGKGTAVEFDINDFDDATVAPLRWDVLRVVTSLLLATRGLGFPGKVSLALGADFVEAHSAALFGTRRTPPVPASVTRLLLLASQKSRADLLLGRTQGTGHHRRFVRGSRYQPISKGLQSQARRAFELYARKLPPAIRPPSACLQVQDLAFRIAGTGSLGGLRLGVMVHGKGGKDGAWLFDMKEEGAAVATRLVTATRAKGAERVLAALERCLAHPPTLAGTTTLEGKSLLVRRLAPQEERLDLASVPRDEWEVLVPYLAARTAEVHRRGTDHLPRPWSRAAAAALLERAITLAGIHEATYLAFCKLTSPAG